MLGIKNKRIYRVFAGILAVIMIIYVISASFSTIADGYENSENSQFMFPVIVIDAGHGGADGGAIAYDGTLEKDINLSVSLKLKNMLLPLGFNVVMTRTEDVLISDKDATTTRQRKSTDIKNRAKLVASYSDSILISIHQNKYSAEKYNGTQVFYSKNNPDSKELAKSIQNNVVSRLQPENKREIMPSGSEIYLLHTANNPAVMVECGFLSNKSDTAKLKTDEYQSEIAFSIICGIIEYVNESKRGIKNAEAKKSLYMF